MRKRPVALTHGRVTLDTLLFKGGILAVGGTIRADPAGPAPAGAVGGKLLAVLVHEFGIQEFTGHDGGGPVFLIGLRPGDLGENGAVRPGGCLAAARRLDGNVIAENNAHAFPIQTVGNGNHGPVFKAFGNLQTIGRGGRLRFFRNGRSRAQAQQAQGGQQGGQTSWQTSRAGAHAVRQRERRARHVAGYRNSNLYY